MNVAAAGVKEGQGVAAPDANKGTPPAGTPAPNASGVGDKTVPLAALLEEREKRQAEVAEKQNLLMAVNQLKGQIAQIQQQGGYQQQPQQQYGQPQMNPQAQYLEQLWASNPREAVRAEIGLAYEQMDRINAQLDYQELEVGKKFPDFSAYKDQVRAYVRTIPVGQRSQPGVMEAAYYFIRGQQVDSLIQNSNAELLRKIKSGEQVQGFEGGSFSPPPQTPQAKAVTDDMRRAAAAMQISIEDYIKYSR